jgi:hypothetical protein
MDPNAALAEFRQHKADADRLGVSHPNYAEVITLAVNAAEALDAWLSRGGFPPEEWREGPDAPESVSRFVIEPTIDIEDWMVVDRVSDPKVAAIVFSGTRAQCEAWVRDNEEN